MHVIENPPQAGRASRLRPIGWGPVRVVLLLEALVLVVVSGGAPGLLGKPEIALASVEDDAQPTPGAEEQIQVGDVVVQP